jgi:hypothetical protein
MFDEDIGSKSVITSKKNESIAHLQSPKATFNPDQSPLTGSRDITRFE